MKRMQTAVSAIVGCDASEIDTMLDQGKGGEAGYTSYQIRVPIRGIIGAAHMLGLSREENTLWHTSSGIITSPQKKEEEDPGIEQLPEREDQ